MARTCELCGKTVTYGNQIARRGMAKYLGGVGVKITGVTRRKFLPNVQHVRFQEPEGRARTARVCTRCIKSGAVTKPTKRDIPEAVRAAMKAKAEAKSPEKRREARKVRRTARK